jgi:site-specific recombinase XerD
MTSTGTARLDAPLIVAFLDDLEHQRGVSVRSRNLRLTAIHSFFRYAAFELPTHAAQIQRVLAILPGQNIQTSLFTEIYIPPFPPLCYLLMTSL